jgi:hypothetical protein
MPSAIALAVMILAGYVFFAKRRGREVAMLASLLALTNFVTCMMEVFSNSVRALKRPKYLLIVGVLCGFLISPYKAASS